MKPFKTLTVEENKTLLKFPAYISLFAANWNRNLDEVEKNSAVRFDYIKTFSYDPILAEFYKEADKVFKKNIEQLDKDLPKGKEGRDAAIKMELVTLEKIVVKLGKEYVFVMRKSMKSFKEHVSKAYDSELVDFIFPIPIPGLSD
jgi:hypothetical protein